MIASRTFMWWIVCVRQFSLVAASLPEIRQIGSAMNKNRKRFLNYDYVRGWLDKFAKEEYDRFRG